MNSVVSPEILGYMEHSSWILRMFEAGIELKKKYGDDQVYDFSLGNPDMPPPPEVKAALLDFAQTADQPYSIGYMPNAGFPDTRAALARKVSQEQSSGIDASHVVVTCGAAGGLNAVFRATLEPGCEVLCPAPYFVEYGFYVSNFGGKLRPVPSHPEDFSLDIEGFRAALSDKTRAVIINSPNNPTGRIYNREELAALADALREQSEKNGRPILLISDEPYRFLNFEHIEIPSLFSLYDDSIVIGSFSKNLSLAGERVGYVAAAPDFHGVKEFIAAVQAEGACAYSVLWPEMYREEAFAKQKGFGSRHYPFGDPAHRKIDYTKFNCKVAHSLADSTISFWTNPTYTLAHIEADVKAFKKVAAAMMK